MHALLPVRAMVRLAAARAALAAAAAAATVLPAAALAAAAPGVPAAALRAARAALARRVGHRAGRMSRSPLCLIRGAVLASVPPPAARVDHAARRAVRHVHAWRSVRRPAAAAAAGPAGAALALRRAAKAAAATAAAPSAAAATAAAAAAAAHAPAAAAAILPRRRLPGLALASRAGNDMHDVAVRRGHAAAGARAGLGRVHGRQQLRRLARTLPRAAAQATAAQSILAAEHVVRQRGGHRVRRARAGLIARAWPGVQAVPVVQAGARRRALQARRHVAAEHRRHERRVAQAARQLVRGASVGPLAGPARRQAATSYRARNLSTDAWRRQAGSTACHHAPLALALEQRPIGSAQQGSPSTLRPALPQRATLRHQA